MTSASPIVGREREQAQLRQVLDDALTGHGRLVLLSGEAGIGKTTLVNDLLTSARDNDCLVLSGGCYDLTTTPPYGPWIEALRGYGLDGSAPGLPSWFGNPEELERVGSQARLFQETAQFLRDIACRQTLVIVLEDLHWSDRASLDALRYLSRSLTNAAILLLATYRDDEITRRHDLYQLLPVLVRENGARRIHVNQLDREAVHDLIRARYELARTDVDRLADHVVARSEGNPLFATEILFGLESEAILLPSTAGWALGDLGQGHVPALLRQILDARLNSLSQAARTALQIAAVIGQEIPLDLWQLIAALGDADVDQIISEAIDARVLVEAPEPEVLRFRHALIRESLYESLIVSRRRAWHRRIGEAFAASRGADPDATAHHFVQAGDRRAAAWLVRAGTRAEGQYALTIAVDHYEAAQVLMDAEPTLQQARGWLLGHIGHLLRYTDRERGFDYLEEAIAIARETGDRVLAAQSQSHRGLMLCFRGNFRRGLDDMEQAYQTMETVSPEEENAARQAIASIFPAEFLSNPRRLSGGGLAKVGALPGINIAAHVFVVFLSGAGHFHRAIEIGEPFTASVAEATNDKALIQDICRDAYNGLFRAYAALGQPERAQFWWLQAHDAFQAINHQMMLVGTLNNGLVHLLTYETENVSERRRVLNDATTITLAINEALHTKFVAEIDAIPLDMLEGRWDHVRTVIAQNADGQRDWSHARMAWLRASCALALEDRDPQDRAVVWDEVRLRFPDLRPDEPGNAAFDHSVAALQVSATLSLDAGDLEPARMWIDALEHWLDWSGAVIGRCEASLLRARYNRITGDADQAHRHAEQALAHASAPRQPLALLVAHRLLGELDTELERLDEADNHLQAALDLAQRCEAPYERALTLLTLAELAVARDDPQDANRLVREARAICEQLGAKRSLHRAVEIEARIRRHTTDHPAGLSDREVEVLEHAATGMTNAEIGEALYISPRTVAQHLRSVYNKLGVNSRAAAVARWSDLAHERIGAGE
jgi:ATP/maltotriose-dependent transcriptional regulator MalT